jgi:hypothetical protein
MRSDLVRSLLIGCIWLVTAIDIWCCQWLTPEIELNPLAAWILVTGDVWTLVAAKIIGTFIATELLRWLHIGYSIAIASTMLLLLLVLSGVVQV